VIETVALASETERLTWLRSLSAALYIDRVFQKEIAPSDLAVRDLIGSGSFGEVYLGEHKGVLVAVKVIQGVNENVAAEFAQEAGVLSSLDHPNILGFVGVCVLDQRRKSMYVFCGFFCYEVSLSCG
jgi:hypothetical protein